MGVAISFVLGVIFGGISGYFGGRADMLIQRMIEFIISIPTIPLWMGLAAALPKDWSVLQLYFGIVIILSLVRWGSLARVVRGKLLELREHDFTMAARLAGLRERAVIARHLLPSFASYLIVHLTLAIPDIILGETALSFLGLGLRSPAVSWGRPAEGGAERAQRGGLPVDADSGGVRDRDRDGVHVRGRRPARRRRPPTASGEARAGGRYPRPVARERRPSRRTRRERPIPRVVAPASGIAATRPHHWPDHCRPVAPGYRSAGDITNASRAGRPCRLSHTSEARGARAGVVGGSFGKREGGAGGGSRYRRADGRRHQSAGRCAKPPARTARCRARIRQATPPHRVPANCLVRTGLGAGGGGGRGPGRGRAELPRGGAGGRG